HAAPGDCRHWDAPAVEDRSRDIGDKDLGRCDCDRSIHCRARTHPRRKRGHGAPLTSAVAHGRASARSRRRPPGKRSTSVERAMTLNAHRSPGAAPTPSQTFAKLAPCSPMPGAVKAARKAFARPLKSRAWARWSGQTTPHPAFQYPIRRPRRWQTISPRFSSVCKAYAAVPWGTPAISRRAAGVDAGCASMRLNRRISVVLKASRRSVSHPPNEGLLDGVDAVSSLLPRREETADGKLVSHLRELLDGATVVPRPHVTEPKRRIVDPPRLEKARELLFEVLGTAFQLVEAAGLIALPPSRDRDQVVLWKKRAQQRAQRAPIPRESYLDEVERIKRGRDFGQELRSNPHAASWNPDLEEQRADAGCRRQGPERGLHVVVGTLARDVPVDQRRNGATTREKPRVLSRSAASNLH